METSSPNPQQVHSPAQWLRDELLAGCQRVRHRLLGTVSIRLRIGASGELEQFEVTGDHPYTVRSVAGLLPELLHRHPGLNGRQIQLEISFAHRATA